MSLLGPDVFMVVTSLKNIRPFGPAPWVRGWATTCNYKTTKA